MGLGHLYISLCMYVFKSSCVYQVPAYACVRVCECVCPLTFQWPTWAMLGVRLQSGSYKSQRQTLDFCVRKMACSCWNVGVFTSSHISLSAVQPTNALGRRHTKTQAHRHRQPGTPRYKILRVDDDLQRRFPRSGRSSWSGMLYINMWLFV